MYFREASLMDHGGVTLTENERVLGEGKLLDKKILRRKFSDFELSWMEAFYDKEPWIKEELEALSEDELSVDYLRSKIWTAAEKKAGDLLEALPAFQVGDWSYLKKNWANTGYRMSLIKICIWQARGEQALVDSEIRSLSLYTWVSTVSPSQSFEQALSDSALDAVDDEDQSQSHETKQREDKIKSLRLKALVLRRKGKSLLAPADYLTQSKSRNAVNAEKAEIHTEAWEELVELGESALHERNAVRYLAIAQKLAETGNEDKLFNYSRYVKDISATDSADGKAHKAGDFFSFSRAGIENFRRQILVDRLKLSEQASMRNLADITNIAEKNNHHGIMRVYGSGNGKYRFKNYEEWSQEVAAEKGKMPTNTILGQSTQFSGFENIPASDFELTGITVPVLEENQLNYYVQNWNAIKFLHNRGQLNPSQAKAAAMPQNAARIIAAASRLENRSVELKDANGQPILDRDTGKPKIIDQREEALRVLQELFIPFGEQQISGAESDANRKALQRLLDEDKIEDRYRQAIKQAQANTLVGAKYRIFKV